MSLSAVAHARDRAERVRAHAQVRDLAQILKAVRLGLDRVLIGIVDEADDADARALTRSGAIHQHLVAALWVLNDLAGRFDRAVRGQLGDVGVIRDIALRDNLDRVEAGSVVQRDERQSAVGLAVASGAHPALERDDGSGCRFRGLLDADPSHANLRGCEEAMLGRSAPPRQKRCFFTRLAAI